MAKSAERFSRTMVFNASHYAALVALDVVCREMVVDVVGKLVSSIQMPFEAVPRARPISPRSEPQLNFLVADQGSMTCL